MQTFANRLSASPDWSFIAPRRRAPALLRPYLQQRQLDFPAHKHQGEPFRPRGRRHPQSEENPRHCSAVEVTYYAEHYERTGPQNFTNTRGAPIYLCAAALREHDLKAALLQGEDALRYYETFELGPRSALRDVGQHSRREGSVQTESPPQSCPFKGSTPDSRETPSGEAHLPVEPSPPLFCMRRLSSRPTLRVGREGSS